MNPEQHGVAVDLDLLADYAGGALDGTPDHARVAHLVATDPAWTTALEELRTAEALVRADLAVLAAAPEPMPADVVARLDTALAEAAAVDTSTPVVSLAARRRKRYRIAAAAAVAAGVIGIAGYGGYAVLGPGGLTAPGTVAGNADTGSGEEAQAPTAEDRGKDAPGAASGDERQRGYPVPVSASGTDYTRQTLSDVRDKPNLSAADAAVRPPRELARLAEPAELTGCLETVRSAYPGEVTMVDYARFEGEPALVIALGTGRVVVAGPDCGLSGPDTRYITVA